LLTRSTLVFYDGTSNHDSFFWVSGAEQLKRHTYMVEPVKSATQPFFNGVGVLAGWRPMWGRIGGEGLLALLSSLVGVSPMKLYVASSAALFIPWVAATFLVARTFLVGRLTTPALIALVIAQPMFAFFHSNANLPNLLGVLTGALVVVATAQSLRGGANRMPWLVLLAFGLHGLLCSYPELAPFILLPGGLLWLRAGFIRAAEPVWQRLGLTSLAYIAGLALNPVTSIRAWFGFFASLGAAQADQNWANIFAPTPVSNYIPALLTMNLLTSADLGFGAALCSLFLLVVLVWVLRGAHDRFGALAMLSGGALLLTYTLVVDFDYGWQKTAQFTGVFTSALLPIAAIDLFSRPPATRRWQPWFHLALAGVSAFSLYATTRNLYLNHKWAERKAITADWFSLRDYIREHLVAAPVLVEGPSFRMNFFHSMWAIYFLHDSHLIFTDRGHENGGYLRAYTRTENSLSTPPRAHLVHADWAATWDANSPRLFAGESVALLKEANRITEMEGFSPDNGVPEFAANTMRVTIRPHHPSHLLFELSPRSKVEISPGLRWRVTRTAGESAPFDVELSGPPPWHINVPLVATTDNRIELTSSEPPSSDLSFPFELEQLRVESSSR
jgi:hypothetical protein